ncbi:hypothetical protein VSX64_10955 [Aurantimonas sp. C2-6-R+9]|uniref:hypothetical protein n=1 Tax=unclassified Aurantimonas TaxID=2638230 RepID=UPI002E17B07B|nr:MULTISPECIES: hypothetical protein [unclassified Aurantimonas]MEC5291069.1 hypothetical protein [Aurantimonas sp. C2-3-R2]MEC5381398.1 hypothetical protein [Aurantimonas sp. C2-6-R+9]MEC5412220.1 hypothetical protein [Aurantimonas sp. C2-4-R8]
MERQEASKDSAATSLPLASLRAQIADLRVTVAALRLKSLAFKAGFRPEQERHPKGRGRVSGRWRREATRKPLEVDIPGPQKKPAADGSPKTPPKSPRLKLPKPGIGHNGGPPLEDPPTIPRQEPPTRRLRHIVVKAVVRFAARALSRGAAGPIGVLLTAIEVARWMQSYYSWIEAYFAAPKTLAELQRGAAQGKRDGYDIHHIVEEDAALKDGFPDSMVNGPSNLVRISRLKHWEISAWYQRINPKFGQQSPRQYLRGKSWEERLQFGIDALRNAKALK